MLFNSIALISILTFSIASPVFNSESQVYGQGDFFPVSFIDYSSPLLFPTASSVFTAGQSGSITWNATLPNGIKQSEVSQTARLILGYLDSNSPGYHLDLQNPLATNIQLYTGLSKLSFTFPSNLVTRSTYILALMGSSGNISPQFTINAMEGTPSSTPAAPSISFSSNSPAPSATTTSSSDVAAVIATSASSILDPISASSSSIISSASLVTSTAAAIATIQTIAPTPSPSSSSSSISSIVPSSTRTANGAVASNAGNTVNSGASKAVSIGGMSLILLFGLIII